eukprot:COSAG02_NODE_1439_length_12594_cov_6.090196_4_plen_54_part_00
MAYITGKVWNDALVGSGAPLNEFKTIEPLRFAAITTFICVVCSVSDALGHFDK